MTFNNLFKFFKNSRLYPKQPNKPVSKLLKAAQEGNADSQFKLGVLYRDTKIDDSEAAHWFRMAAEQCHSNAQTNLGWMYENGEGVAKDYVQAYKWFNLSAAAGHEPARLARDHLTKSMSSAQVAEAQKLSSQWRPSK